MKYTIFFLLTLVLGCGGSLSDEQRKKLREGMEDQAIVKVSDAEIVTASLEQGRTVYEAMEKHNFNPPKIDSIAGAHRVKIKLIRPGSATALEVEKQLIEAYVVGAETGAIQENIQKLHAASNSQDYDSLVYTRPKVQSLPDGAVSVEGIWNIYLPKKEVIRSIQK